MIPLNTWFETGDFDCNTGATTGSMPPVSAELLHHLTEWIADRDGYARVRRVCDRDGSYRITISASVPDNEGRW